MQKVHNVEVALNALNAMGISIAKPDAKSIVDGHRERTLAVLWKVIGHFSIASLIDDEALRKEIAQLKRRRAYINDHSLRRASGCEMFAESPQLNLLFEWARVVCGLYGVEVCSPILFFTKHVIAHLVLVLRSTT